MRTVVVGASSGLGRCIGIGLAQRGARVALLARRLDRLERAAAEAGAGALAVACDVTNETSVHTAVEEAASGLGGIDALVYTVGVGHLRRLADIDAAASELGGIDALVYAPAIGPLARLLDLDVDTWRRAFDTNVIGAALVTAAAMPHLSAAAGRVVYLSSVSASLTPPWPGLGAYVVSKAALDKLVEAWRAEHADVAFTRLVVGDAGGGTGESQTGFTAEWDAKLGAELGPIWFQRGLLSGALIEIDDLVGVIHAILCTGATASLPSVTVTPRVPKAQG